MTSLFIADLHLNAQAPETLNLALDCLKELAPQYDKLYILGDLFEYWLGDDAEDPQLNAIFTALKELSKKDCAVYFMHGNRDFLLGEAFAKKYCITLLDQDEFILRENGVELILMHGDTLCSDDIAYQQLRTVLRNQLWQQDFLQKPISERIAAANALREKSRQAMQDKSVEIMDVNETEVSKTFTQHNIPIIIHGHTHRPQIHHYSDDKQRWVLGDWHSDGGKVISLDKNGLKMFHWPERFS